MQKPKDKSKPEPLAKPPQPDAQQKKPAPAKPPQPDTPHKHPKDQQPPPKPKGEPPKPDVKPRKLDRIPLLRQQFQSGFPINKELTVTRKIQSGTSIFEATRSGGDSCILKIFPTVSASDQDLDIISREMDILMDIKNKSKNVVSVKKTGENKEFAYIVMEQCHGDVHELIESLRGKDSQEHENVARAAFAQMLDGISFLHRHGKQSEYRNTQCGQSEERGRICRLNFLQALNRHITHSLPICGLFRLFS
ncbi:hypothetical protein BC936DRAFT_137074 [Jimgerdemannia flammicorona]|uniref:Protein kinase domain-containing protein n=1 Tax=Jimgerdemannia flammicorona TaxID=994334 RepID=A0A433DJH9_9FUNG|nr:hypothetical protein BC936DRAFT_137074 [Jimgerdemannia flammicorona]